MWRICFLVCLALTPVLRAELKLMAVFGEKTYPVVRVDKATLYANKEGKEVKLAPMTPLIVEGDLLSHRRHIAPSRNYVRNRRIEPVTVMGKESMYSLLIRFFRDFPHEEDTFRTKLNPADEEDGAIVFALLSETSRNRAVVISNLNDAGRQRKSAWTQMDLFSDEENPVIIALCFTNHGWLEAPRDFLPDESAEVWNALVKRDQDALKRFVASNPKAAWTPIAGGDVLTMAAFYGLTEELRILAGANGPDTKRFKGSISPLGIAARNGHESTVAEILRWNPSIKNAAGHDVAAPIISAAYGNHASVVRLLMEAKVDLRVVDARQRTAFSNAINDGFVDVAKLLEKAESSLNFRDKLFESVLATQIREHHHGMVEYLLDKKVSIQAAHQDPTPLHHAVVADDERMVRLLLARGAQLKSSPAYPPPLHLAARDSSVGVVKALLDAGVDVNEEWNGAVAITGAVVNDRAEAVEMLLKAGANRGTKSPNGYGLLEIALVAHADEVARKLVAAGVKLTGGKEELGEWLVRALTLDVVGVLPQAEASGWDPKAPLDRNWNALDIARACMAKECEAWLTDKGVAPNRPPVAPVKNLDERIKPVATVVPVDTRSDKMKEHGVVVTIEIIVDEEGRVLFPRALDQVDPALRVSTAETLQQWTFSKPLVAGVPVATRVRLPLKYNGYLDNAYLFDDLDVSPKPEVRTNPVYPLELKQKGITGSVTLEFVIDASGKVIHAKPVTITHPLFSEAAITCLKTWKFTPAMIGGKPVACRATQAFLFSLDDRK